jgi:glycosyltransferase involved in cell wall biosynthesis
MKVLLVTTSYPSLRAPHNGVFIREHCLELKRRGFECFVLAPRVFREDPVDFDDEGIAVHRFPFWSEGRLLTEYAGIPVARMFTYLVSGVVAAARMARRIRPDVIHGHWAIPTGLIAVVANRLTVRRPVLITVHRKDIVVALSGSWIARMLARFALTRADRVIAVSRALRATLIGELGVDASRIDVVPMGVDTAAFAPGDMASTRRHLGIPHDARLALFVGGLIEVKGVRDLIEAMPLVRPDDPGVLLVLAGHGPLSDELRARVDVLGQSGRVRLLGAVPHEELPMWMNAADTLVLPSYSEGLPVCLMEAAAAGLPMVATAVDGSVDVLALDPVNIAVTPGDVEGLAAALSVALARPREPRASMLLSAPLFTMEGSVARIAGLYAALAGSDARG